MSKKSFLDRAMARLGYVPAPAKQADSLCSLKFDIDIDSTPIDATLAKLAELTAATAEAEARLLQVCASATVTAKALIQLQAVTSAGKNADDAAQVRAYDPATGTLVPIAGQGATPADPLKETIATFLELAPAVTAAAEKRFTANPFAPVFEVEPGEDAITIKLYPRPGSVQYIVNVTGPRSSALTFESALPRLSLVSQVVESPL